ncbi:uncharacterized protein [Arachis hypogaea]|uniref:uncharacterized protein n=1 Tax=Arachis hypogaea TaxID=3818 RepID=UPI0007AF038B
MIGGQDLGADDAEEDADYEGLKFPVHKPEKDMRNYKWKVGTLYESRQEFKDMVAAYAVQTTSWRGINMAAKKHEFAAYLHADTQVVEAETKDSWAWFLCHLAEDLGREKIEKCTFMSDQQKGLLSAFEEVIPGVDNRFYVRHLYNNFWKKFSGLELKNRMWRFTFHSKCDTLVNNMSESFNAVIVEAREKPIVTIKKLEKRESLARDWRPYWSAASKYEVMCRLDKFVVDLDAAECSCRKWQMSGISCPHAISCISFKRLDLESYVDDCYKKDAYLKCYQEVIHLVNRPNLWERTQYDDVMPPPYRRPSHRPIKKRK